MNTISITYDNLNDLQIEAIQVIVKNNPTLEDINRAIVFLEQWKELKFQIRDHPLPDGFVSTGEPADDSKTFSIFGVSFPRRNKR